MTHDDETDDSELTSDEPILADRRPLESYEQMSPGLQSWPPSKPRRPPPHIDTTRRTITYGLLLAVFLVVAAYFVLPAVHVLNMADAGGVFDRTFAPLLGLAATALGFYFGDASQRPGRRDRDSDDV